MDVYSSSVTSIEGYNHALIITDSCSENSWQYGMKTKDEVLVISERSVNLTHRICTYTKTSLRMCTYVIHIYVHIRTYVHCPYVARNVCCTYVCCSVCMHVLHVYARICTYICQQILIRAYTCIYVHTFIYGYTCIYVHTFIYVHRCIYVKYMHIHAYTCIHAYTYIEHTYVQYTCI